MKFFSSHLGYQLHYLKPFIRSDFEEAVQRRIWSDIVGIENRDSRMAAFQSRGRVILSSRNFDWMAALSSTIAKNTIEWICFLCCEAFEQIRLDKAKAMVFRDLLDILDQGCQLEHENINILADMLLYLNHENLRRAMKRCIAFYNLQTELFSDEFRSDLNLPAQNVVLAENLN